MIAQQPVKALFVKITGLFSDKKTRCKKAIRVIFFSTQKRQPALPNPINNSIKL